MKGKQSVQPEPEKPPEPENPPDQEPDLSAADVLVRDFEDSVGSILEMAEPLLQDCIGDASAVEEVETSARDLEKQVPSLRSRVSELTQVTTGIPVQLRSKCIQGAQKMQTRLMEATKKLAPLKNFKAHFKERSEAKKETESLEASLSEVELEVEKVSMMLTLSSQIQMCEEELELSERLLKEAQTSLQTWNVDIVKRLPRAAAAAAAEMRRLKQNGQEHNKKMDQLFQKIKSQRSGLYARQLVKEATAKVVIAEDSLMKCSEAEMPFLKGIEVLPKEESVPALRACDMAIKASLAAEGAALAFLRSKIPEVKRLAIEQSANNDMDQLLKRTATCREKIDSFKQETEQRRSSSCLADVMVHMQKAVSASAELKKWAGICEKGLEASVEELTKALDEAPKAQKALAQAVADTSKQLVKEAQEASASQKQDIKSRLAAMTQEATKHRATVVQASKALKSKELLEDQQRRTDQLEAQLAHLQEISASLSEEEEQVMEEQKVMETLQKSLQTALNAAQLRASNAEPSLKTALQSILERQRKVHTQLNTLVATSKERREKTLTELWQRGATERLDQLQKLKTEAEQLEIPFLRGLEVLPYEEAIDAVTGMEEVAKKMEAGLQEARTFIAAKSLACKAMGATKQRDQLLQRNAALPPLSSWLGELRQTNLARRKAAQAQAAEAKIAAFEKAVDALVEEAAKDDDEKLLKNCEARRAKVSTLEALAREAHEALKSTASKELQPDWQSSVVRLKRAEKKLETSVTRKLKEFERQVSAGKLIVQVKKDLEEMDAEVKICETKAGLALAPTPSVLCQETMAVVLQEHMKDKAWSFEQLFKDLANGNKQVSPEQLVKYVTTLKPKAISEEQREAWLQGQQVPIDSTSLKSLARRCGKCAAAARVENEKGELVTELKPGDLLVIHGTKGTRDGKELLEVELLSGVKGFASCKTKEKLQLLPCSTFEFHCEELERIVQESLTKIQAKVTQLTSEAKEVQTGPDEVRAELGKLTPKLQVPVAGLSLLQKKIAVSKRNFAKGQASERQKLFDNLHQNEAEEVVAKMEAKVEVAEALQQELQTKLAKLKMEGPGAIEECQRPVSLQKELNELHKKIVAATDEAKAVVLQEPEKVKSCPPAVKQQLVKLTKRSQKAKSEGASEIKTLEKAVEAIRTSAFSKLSVILRKSPSHAVLRSKQELEKLIRKELDAPEEHQQLLIESLGDDELKLLQLSQKYLMVQRPIAMTNSSNLEDAKTVRKLASPELLQVLEGPSTCGDLQRVFARALRDGVEGWVTMEGNQGTSYVKDAPKPFYVCISKEIALGDDTLKLGEVVELLQGPDRTSSNIKRARCKALSDQASGWFTLVDKFGTAYAEKLPNLYKCASAVAMTEELDIESKVIGRLAKGTCLMPEGDPSTDPKGGLQRLFGRIVGSGSVGWVTVKGNAGTVFLEACQNHYAILQPTSLEKSREMQVDEVVQVLEVKEETSPNEQRMKVRNLTRGHSGWISLNPKFMKPWSKQYTARVSQSLKDGTEVLREVAKGEQFQALGLPKSEDGMMKVRVKAKKDGIAGSLLVHDKQQLLDF